MRDGRRDRKRLKGEPREKLAVAAKVRLSLRVSRLPKWKVTSVGYVNTIANVRLSMLDHNEPEYMILLELPSL